jgi:FtsH-binding integral membrane protein
MRSNTAAGRRYLRRFWPTMIAYVVVLFACIWAIKHWHPSGAALVVLSVLPALPILACIAVMGLYLVEETDEFLRQRIASSMLVGTGVLLAAVTVYGFLTNGRAIEPDPEIAIWGFPLWCASWGLAQCVMAWRDRAGGGE